MTTVIHRDGTKETFTLERIIQAIRSVAKNVISNQSELEHAVAKIITRVELKLPEEVTTEQFDHIVLKATEQLISVDPMFDKIAAMQLIKIINSDVSGKFPRMKDYVAYGIEQELLDPRLADFDYDKLEWELQPEHDSLFNFFGIATFYDRYLMKDREKNVIEKPQRAWMRVAMGLSLLEDNKEEFALKIYKKLASFQYIHATPTLYNSGLPNAQFSSCFINVVGDSMDGIMGKVNETAQFAKYAGGVGTAVSKMRASGSHIKSLNAKSSGPIPFLKIFDTTVNSIMQGGRRRSSQVMYMEPRHYNIEEFLDLKETNGSPYLRAPSLNTAIWTPDCFMERVESNQDRWLFDPAEAPELTTTRGEEFTNHYNAYCEKAEQGEMKLAKKMNAKTLYDRILFQLAKTGNYRVNFKDTHNRANQAPSYGLIHSSNLCTEISIPNSEESTAVCTLASINLSKCIATGEMDFDQVAALSLDEKIDLIQRESMKETIQIAVRALDNAMELNFYPSPEAKKNTNDLRPMGLGLMGVAEMFIDLGVSYESADAIVLIDKIGEFVYANALETSQALAEERGTFGHYNADTYDYAPRRNALLMSIQPTASTSLIMGTSSTVDPYFANVYSRETLGGKFTIIIEQLVEQLKAKGVWSEELKNKIIANGGSIQSLEELDGVINKDLFKTAYEFSWQSQVDIASTLQQHVDQGISRNMYLPEHERANMHDVYMYARKKGLKGTYYCFIQKTIQGEKYTQNVNKRGERKGFGARAQVASATGAASGSTPVKRGFGATQPTASSAKAELTDIDLKNITDSDKIRIRQKLIEDKGEEYVTKLEKGELYKGSCPADPFEAVMCEACQ